MREYFDEQRIRLNIARQRQTGMNLTMTDNLIFLAVIAQIILTFWLYAYLAIAKARASTLGLVDETRRGLHDDAWPENILQINNCIKNQFEVPVLFYALITIAWATSNVVVIIHVLAWFFVTSRIIHAIIHTGSNLVPLRRRFFMLGCLSLVLMTLFLTYRIIFS